MKTDPSLSTLPHLEVFLQYFCDNADFSIVKARCLAPKQQDY